jgi:ABC-type nitrate/sulfonate/bicarbonate transport system substrate-binding protein
MTVRDGFLTIWLIVLLLTVFFSKIASAQQLETLNASYASVTGSRIPLWIAKDAGLFEKYGLNVNLVVIAAGTAAIGALASGDVEILGAPGSTTMVSAARGLPLAIIGTFGPSAWKLAAHSSITNIEQLRGKTVGISRPGTTVEFATKRALAKLGFIPGKDIQILATGLAESSFRKHLREQDARRLDTLYKNYVVDALPLKPYPMEDALQGELENLSSSVPELRGKKAADFIDKSLLNDLERDGFLNQLANKYGKQQ